MAVNDSNDRPTQTVSESQVRRRVKFGTNVVVASIVAVSIVVMLNLIMFWQVPASAPYRIDMTAARRFSLTEQTARVLERLEGEYRIISVIAPAPATPAGAEQQRLISQSIDKIDEYAARSEHIRVRHFQPGYDLVGQEQLYAEIHDRFSEQLQPVEQAIKEAQKVLAAVSPRAAEQTARIEALAADAAVTRDQVRQTLETIAGVYANQAAALSEQLRRVEQFLAGPMPDYQGAVNLLEANLSAFVEGLLQPAAQAMDQLANNSALAGSVRNELLSLGDVFGSTAKVINAALGQLRQVTIAPRYVELLDQLAGRDVIIVMGPQQVRVIALTDMYRLPETAQLPPDQRPEAVFLGEEQLTGALMAMTLKTPPLVVFVYQSQPALGPRGSMTYVAERLEAMNIQVRQWTPEPQTRGPNQQAERRPMPQPGDGQAVVWVLIGDGGGGGGGMMGGPADGPLAQIAEEKLASGDGVLALVGPGMMYQFQPSAMAPVLARFGVRAIQDRMILRAQAVAQGQTVAIPNHLVRQWPQGGPITKPMSGMPGIFVAASPIEISDDRPEGTQVWPLARVTGEQVWAETELNPQTMEQMEFDPEAAAPAEGFVVAAAAKQGEQRLVLISDIFVGFDDLTTFGQHPLFGSGPGLARIGGAMYPGNTELLVNSVLWLSGLEHLIAPGPRTQDIRRIAAVSPGTMTSLRWAILAGLPAAILVIGTVVLMARRRD